MLWAAPLLVFAVAQLLSYSGRPELSLFDRTLTATKFAGATLGVELIGVNVANVTMPSYRQRTISHPVAEEPATEGLEMNQMDTEPDEEDMQPAMDVITAEESRFPALSDPNPNDETSIPIVESIEAFGLSDPEFASPDFESDSPDLESQSPDPESTLPDPESTLPDPGPTLPDSESTLPHSESALPDPKSDLRYYEDSEAISLDSESSTESESTFSDSEPIVLDSESDSTDSEATSSDAEPNLSTPKFSLLNMLYGLYMYLSLFKLHPQGAWFTIYLQLLTTLIGCILIGLFYRSVGKAYKYVCAKLSKLYKVIRKLCGHATRVTDTLDYMEGNTTFNREQTWKYMDEIRIRMEDFLAAQKNDYRDLTKGLARLESNMHVIEERSRKLDTDWDTSLTIENIKSNLVQAYTTLARWQVVFKNEQAKLANTFANNLVNDTGYIMLSLERAIEAVQKVAMKEESFATYAQPQNPSTDQNLFPMQGPPQVDYATTCSTRTLTKLEKPDPTKEEIEQMHAQYAQDELIWTENQKKTNGKNKPSEFEPLRTKIEREEKERKEIERKEFEPLRTKIECEEKEQKEKEQKEKEQKEKEQKEKEQKEKEQKENESKANEPKKIERKEIERKEIEQKANEPAEAEPKKTAKVKKGAKPKKGPESKESEST